MRFLRYLWFWWGMAPGGAVTPSPTFFVLAQNESFRVQPQIESFVVREPSERFAVKAQNETFEVLPQ